jgi:hypothetical protein
MIRLNIGSIVRLDVAPVLVHSLILLWGLAVEMYTEVERKKMVRQFRRMVGRKATKKQQEEKIELKMERMGGKKGGRK